MQILYKLFGVLECSISFFSGNKIVDLSQRTCLDLFLPLHPLPMHIILVCRVPDNLSTTRLPEPLNKAFIAVHFDLIFLAQQLEFPLSSSVLAFAKEISLIFPSGWFDATSNKIQVCFKCEISHYHPGHLIIHILG